MLVRPNYLFSEENISSFMSNRLTRMEKYIDDIDGNRLLNASVEDLVGYCAEEYAIVMPCLRRDNSTVEQREGVIDLYDEWEKRHFQASGQIIELTIPFDGDAVLFKVTPRTFTLNRPAGNVKGADLIILVKGRDLMQDQVKSAFENQMDLVEEYLNYLKTDIGPFNSDLSNLARARITQRRTKLLANQNLVAGLGFKLKERPDASKTFSAPVTRRRLHPKPPQAASASYTPEPVLDDAEYKNILDLMANMASVMERSPKAFNALDEESLRMHFLVQLNGQYEGQATGETFNFNGKTDILIRHANKNIFIAECKYWRGAKGHTETIDQIMSYLSWRDTKAAIVVFNRNKGFSNVLAEMNNATEQHLLFKAGPTVESETRYRYVFGQASDPAREVILTILAFDVPT